MKHLIIGTGPAGVVAAEHIRRHDPDAGIVLIDRDRCIGCRECMEACPFGAMQFDDDRETAIKCDLCIDRLNRGQAPACSQVCATGTIFWGDAGGLLKRIDGLVPR